MPTTTASTDARQRWASSRLSSPLIHCESPVRVATLPSSVIADLNSTHGRPTRACLRKAWLSSRARAASSLSASSTSTPSSRRIPRPRPEAFSVGSSEATTTRLIPACRIASVHGGVLPSWQHGSSDTYSVAPLRSATPHASIALTSACTPPNCSCQPSPSTSPSRATTAPTTGLGLTAPSPLPASSIARSRCARSVSVQVVIAFQDIPGVEFARTGQPCSRYTVISGPGR